jgi:hypothetical protein
MNTANLQLEGLLLALAGLVDELKRKGMLSQGEVAHLLANAESNAARREGGARDISPANVDAILFPIRFLRQANIAGIDAERSFSDTAAAVGQSKPER